jgi:acyl-coenzyme A thioesterase PaaI-like protein
MRPSPHANVAGRELELRSLADAVRRLIRVTTNNAGDVAWTRDAAERVHALADALEPALPETPPSRYALIAAPEQPDDIFPYDALLGPYNPLAMPIEMTWEPPKAIGTATFDTPYEGPPGHLHGAILAAAFDQVINVANILSGTAGPTATLSLEYVKPTPLHVPIVFEAWVDSVDGRKVRSRAHAVHDGEVTVRAEGLFIAIDRDRVMDLSGRDSR